MEYRAVGNRCAVDIETLRIPISREETLSILTQKGFRVVEVDLVTLARRCVGVSKYGRGTKLSEAPAIVDCSSFTKWLYAQRGIWLPRRSIQQREFGQIVPFDEIGAGDLVFVSAAINYYFNARSDCVGHVGLATDDGTVIHAANRKANIVETALEKFVGKTKFRGARRYVPRNCAVLTLETPRSRGVEISDDIKWIVLQALPNK